MTFGQIMNDLNINSTWEWAAFVGLVGGSVIIVILRALLCSVYVGQRGLLKANGKEVKKKDDIKSIKKFPMLLKLVKDYQKIGDKGIANIDTAALVKRHIANLSFLGWNYVSMENLVSDGERAIPVIGLIFMFLFDNAAAFGIFSVAVFILLKILAAIFDFRVSRKKLTYDLVEYLDREIGQFYIGDFASAISRLKAELIGGITNQAVVLSQSMDKLGKDLSAAIADGIDRVSVSFSEEIEKFGSYANILEIPLNQWKEAVSQAYDAQEQMNAAAYHLNDTVAGMQNALGGMEDTAARAVNSLKDGILDYTSVTAAQTGIVKKVLEELLLANEGLKDQINHVGALNEAVTAQLSYLQENQMILDRTVHEYEQGLQSFTSSLSEGFGGIISYHVEDAYHSLNAQLQENIKQIILSNTAVVSRIEQLFQQIAEQSKGEMQALITMKEQMDIRFDNISQ